MKPEVILHSFGYLMQAAATTVAVSFAGILLGFVIGALICVARDANGHALGSLKQEDFSIYDDGKQQQLSGFTIVNRVPRAGASSESPPSAPTAESNSQPATPPVPPAP